MLGLGTGLLVVVVTVLLSLGTPRFIGTDLWPTNSPDLNPVDYKIWACMQEHVYKLQIKDLSELKQQLINA